MNNIYQITKPYASFCIFSNILLGFFHSYTNKKIINKKNSENDIIILSQIYLHNNPLNNHKLNLLSSEIRERMDKDTWKIFIKSLRKTPEIKKQKDIFENVAIKNIKTQFEINLSSLVLKSLGYLAMILCAWYPSTVIQAITCTFMSSLYTTQFVYQKWCKANNKPLLDISGMHIRGCFKRTILGTIIGIKLIYSNNF